MRMTLHGAAGGVTGSACLVETDRARVLVDFGIFQGRQMAGAANVIPTGLDVSRLDAVVLTHGHLDHVGRLPLLAKYGYRGPIVTTDATRDLTELILHDAAKIQAGDVEPENRRRRQTGRPLLEPLYTLEHVQKVLDLFSNLEYHDRRELAPGLSICLRDAGHILGSASVEITAEESGRRRTVVCSGDLGARGAPILRDPEPGAQADLVLMESTYGDRDHRPLAETVTEFENIVRGAVEQRGRVLVPTFAIGRAQQILYHLAEMFRQRVVLPFPVYLDSPMAIDATRIYFEHPELYDEEALKLRHLGQFQKDLASLHLVGSPQESRALAQAKGPCMILAGAGMCNAGRIVEHLRGSLPQPTTCVIIVGYQAEGTLGRQLVDGMKRVSIRGERVLVRASVHTLGGFSAHGGQTELLEWLGAAAARHPRVVLVHGEDRARRPLADKIRERFGIEAELPYLGDVLEV